MTFNAEEYEMVTINQLISKELHNLDLFNLEVAKFRVKYGVSRKLIHLYGAMGRLSQKLLSLQGETLDVSLYWGDITDTFQKMKDREEE